MILPWTGHPLKVEKAMVLHFSQLNEKNKRHYAALSAIKLGYGGQKYISELFKISTYRIRSGIKELNTPELLDEIPPQASNAEKEVGEKKRN